MRGVSGTVSVMKKYASLKRMSEGQRIAVVQDIFSSISRRYDFLNRVFSLCRDVAWRRLAVSKLHPGKTGLFLDLAAGTGDLSIAAAVRHPGLQCVAVDFVQEMLCRCQEKIRSSGLEKRVFVLRGDALYLF